MQRERPVSNWVCARGCSIIALNVELIEYKSGKCSFQCLYCGAPVHYNKPATLNELGKRFGLALIHRELA